MFKIKFPENPKKGENYSYICPIYANKVVYVTWDGENWVYAKPSANGISKFRWDSKKWMFDGIAEVG